MNRAINRAVVGIIAISAIAAVAVATPAFAQDRITATHVFPANWVYSKSFLEFVKKANEAGKGLFSGFGTPLLIGAGLIGLFLIARSRDESPESSS